MSLMLNWKIQIMCLIKKKKKLLKLNTITYEGSYFKKIENYFLKKHYVPRGHNIMRLK